MKFGKFKYMSRIGKKSIEIGDNVEVRVEGRKIYVKGPKGELQMDFRPEVKIEIRGKEIFIIPDVENKNTRAFWGLTRMLVFNMVKGVTEGFEKRLSIEGIGFKANLEGEDLVLNIGYTHPVKVKAPNGIKFSVEKNIIILSGISKALVSQTAANIRKIKKPEPYKGKGIRYLGEVVRKKVGKKATAAK